jgi:hypothetical protein
MNSTERGTNEETASSNSAQKGITFGAIGGLIAGLIMAGIGYAIPVPGMMGEPFFINSADMWKLSDKVMVGWTLHIVTSLAIGVIFGLMTTRVSTLRLTSMTKGLVLGAITGVVVFILVFLPVEIPPMPGLVSASNFLLESFGYNLVFGLVLGATVAGLVLRTHKTIAKQNKTISGAKSL